MKYIFFFQIAFLIFSHVLLAQTTYYISNSKGNDKNTGLTQSDPFKTIQKVNELSLLPGDEVLFKKGDIWRGISLYVENDHVNGEIHFGNYGNPDDNKPIITLLNSLTDWDNKNKWTKYSYNIWKIPIDYIIGLQRIFLDEKEATRSDSKSGISEDSPWYASDKYLYLYAGYNPSSYYKSIKVPYNDQNRYSLTLKGNGIRISNLIIEGGIDAVHLINSNNTIIEDCEIGYGTSRYGIRTMSKDNMKSDNVIIRNNIIDSGFKIKYNYRTYFLSGSDGISLVNGANNWKIYNNKIRNWYHSSISLIALNDQTVSGNEIYSNYLTAKDVSYCRAISMAANKKGQCFNNKFYNNRIEYMPTRSQIGGNDNELFYNIVTYAERWDVRPTVASAFSLEGNISKGNKIFNNTIYSTDSYAIIVNGNENSVFNNLIINSSTESTYGIFINNDGGNHSIQNNIIAEQYLSSKSPTIAYDGYGYCTFSLQLLDYSKDIIIDNEQYEPIDLKVKLSDLSFIPQSGSPTINSGIKTEINKDFYGYQIVDKPDIGAVEFGSSDKSFEEEEEIPIIENPIKLNIKNASASSTKHTLTSPLYTIDGKGAFDGDLLSRWSTYSLPEWIVYDFGKVNILNKSKISFYQFDKGRTYEYSIKVSKDGSTWKTIVDRNNSASSEWTINNFKEIKARYVKIILHSSNNTYWATIWETELFGAEYLTTFSNGWNSFTSNFENSGIQLLTDKGNKLNSLYQYNKGYQSTNSLKIGEKYWSKSDYSGNIYVTERESISRKKNISKMDYLTVTDAEGKKSSLYISKSADFDNPKELPPVKDQKNFDVRFSNNMNVKNLNDEDIYLSITGAKYPLTITSSVNNLVVKNKQVGSTFTKKLTDKEKLIIKDKLNNKLYISAHEAPKSIFLNQNYPNPFNPTTSISFQLPKSSRVKLTVYNSLGEVIKNLVDKNLESGEYSVQFNGSALSSGIYFYTLTTNNKTLTRKMLLVK